MPKQISSAFAGRVPRRTLQRRLALLVEQKRLKKEGQARAIRYRCLPVSTGKAYPEEEPDIFVERREVYIPLSPEGEELKKAIRKPVQVRQPVGYNRTILDSYRPNSTFYLTLETRQRLYEIGRSPKEQKIAGTYGRQIFNRLLVDLSWNSSRLEGNTYSLLETECLLELGEAAEGKKAMETQIPSSDQSRFIEVVETELSNLHEGNFARYGLRPLDFVGWKKVWC